MGDDWHVAAFQVWPTADCSGAPIVSSGEFASTDAECDALYRQGCSPNVISNGNPIYPSTSGFGGQWNGGMGDNNVDRLEQWIGFNTNEPQFGQCVRVFQCGSTGCAPGLLLQSMTPGASSNWTNVAEWETNIGAWSSASWTNAPQPPAPQPPPPTPPPPPVMPPPSAPNTAGITIGVICGAVAGVILLVFVLYYLVCKKKQTPEFKGSQGGTQMEGGAKMPGKLPAGANA